MQPRTPAKTCVLCGRAEPPEQLRDLGEPPVVVTVCTDLSGCVERHRNRPAT